MGPQDHTSPNSSLGSATPQAHQREAHISLIHWARTHSMSMKTWIKTTQIVLSRKQGLSLCKLEAERQGMLRQLEDVHQGLSQLLGTRHKVTEQNSSQEVPPNPQVLYPGLGCSCLPQMDAKTEVCWATTGTSEEKKNQDQAS